MSNAHFVMFFETDQFYRSYGSCI